jgi:hypothetical protein
MLKWVRGCLTLEEIEKILGIDKYRIFLSVLSALKLNPAKMQLISGFIDTYLRLNKIEEQYS